MDWNFYMCLPPPRSLIFLIPFYLQAVQIHSAIGVKLLDIDRCRFIDIDINIDY
jgi:hypothetical protein